ncbi:hypothetical protein E4U42_001213 [Claviceps africana]|uniref:Uncharacterized protein n=1 Tax=Claviceps africana TaxID=83212 RepID=A0A8K0NHG2_9HYPO|nr:hypothetical protein E4U42_001213 [Claviceps africana]
MFAAALGIALFAVRVCADGSRDLGSVLAGNKDVSKFYNLIKKFPDVLLQLPNYSGVTMEKKCNVADCEADQMADDGRTVNESMPEEPASSRMQSSRMSRAPDRQELRRRSGWA